MDPDKIGWAAEMACLLEVSAEKPGNVTRRKDFNDTTFVDFIIRGSPTDTVAFNGDRGKMPLVDFLEKIIIANKSNVFRGSFEKVECEQAYKADDQPYGKVFVKI